MNLEHARRAFVSYADAARFGSEARSVDRPARASGRRSAAITRPGTTGRATVALAGRAATVASGTGHTHTSGL